MHHPSQRPEHSATALPLRELQAEVGTPKLCCGEIQEANDLAIGGPRLALLRRIDPNFAHQPHGIAAEVPDELGKEAQHPRVHDLKGRDRWQWTHC